jgi:hypothetical protein
MKVKNIVCGDNVGRVTGSPNGSRINKKSSQIVYYTYEERKSKKAGRVS